MRTRTLRLLAGTAVPLILTGSALAGFTGISTTSNVFDYWSAKIRWRLCKQRNGKDCQNPDD